MLQYWGGVLKKKFVKFVVQDLTSGGLLGVWGKWVKHAKYIYNIQDFNPEQVLAVAVFLLKCEISEIPSKVYMKSSLRIPISRGH